MAAEQVREEQGAFHEPALTPSLSSARTGRRGIAAPSHHGPASQTTSPRSGSGIAWLAGLALPAWLFLAAPFSIEAAATDAELRQAVEADWAAQERRLGREPDDAAAVAAALERYGKLLANLRAQDDAFREPRPAGSMAPTHAPLGVPAPHELDLLTPALSPGGNRGERARANAATPQELDRDSQAHAAIAREVDQPRSLDPATRLDLYHRVRWATRRLILRSPLVTGQPLVFLKRHRFVCQMLHEYLGYFYDYGDVAGGGVYRLEEPGRSFRTRDLIGGRLPRGNVTTLALSYDARTLYFAFAERAPAKPDFYSSDRRSFHLYTMNADGSGLRPLTEGGDDDFDPCPLPDGGLAFMSSRRGGFGRCHNPWEPLPTYTLHRMNADGSGIQTLSWHETNEWHPWVLNDGRIIYTRWDYVDRSAANYHGLWISNPDGTSPVSLFGNYTTRINACYQPRAIPGSPRVLFVAGAHHADVGGSLVIVDPRRVALDPMTGEDALDAVEVLTPEVCFAEADGWPKSYFHAPWPLSEDQFLVGFSFDPLPGMSSGENRDTRTGLYYFDRWGNLELLYRDPEASAMYPIPLASRPIPPQVAATRDATLGDAGEFLVQDVRRSLLPLPADRSVRELRVFQVLPKTPPHVANQPRLGYANAESARLLLGSVPVEADGSARFLAPARKPLYFQLVDDEGRAIQTMRSITYLQPGERRGCVGCHEPPRTVASPLPVLAARRPPSRIEPGPDGSRPLSYPRLVQPVLDRHCVRCHNGSSGPDQSPLLLTGEPAGTFSRSYENLKPLVRWHEWGGASISQTATRPGHCGADESPFTRVLADATHAPLGLPQADLRRLYLWLDANAPFYGVYAKLDQIAQRGGEAVPLPALQ